MELESQLTAAKAEIVKLKTALHREQVGTRIESSKFVRGLKMPPDLVRGQFIDAFRADDDGKTFAVDATGAKVWSRLRPGKVADVDEAIELLVAAHPHRDVFISGKPATAASTDKPAATAGPTMKRAVFDALGPAQKMTVARSGTRVID